MPLYEVLIGTVRPGGGERRGPGKTVELPEKQGEELSRKGIVKLAEGEAKDETEISPEREAAIRAGIANLTKGDKDHWTRSGLPELKPLRAMEGLSDLTAAERDAVWEKVKEETPPDT